MKTSRFDDSILAACRYFIYLALVLMIVLLFLSGAFSGKGIPNDNQDPDMQYIGTFTTK